MTDTVQNPSVWETKRRLEAAHPDIPHIDISAPDFDIFAYGARVQALLREAGIPIQPYSITWQDLTCTVPVEPPQRAIATVVSGISKAASAIKNGFANVMPHHNHNSSADPPPPADVLHAVSGYLRPRQMCLVLGASGSGTSLLLSRIAGRSLPRMIQSSGSVLYQGEQLFAGITRPSHVVHYIGQSDMHIPQLTVRHTLEFAAACKWPAWVPHVDSLRQNDVILTARLLGIERSLETVVGSDVLRGISGGERKRVTIGEMGIGLVGGTLVMDNWSKGLDSSTTLSITQSMRKFADNLQGSVIVSMQAPGAEVFKLFDTLCLLHEGRLIYFGSVKGVEGYFNNLGFRRPLHRSLPDFVSTLSDPHLRSDYVAHVQSGEPSPPESAEELARHFEKSPLAADLASNIDEIINQPHLTLPPGSADVVKLGKRSTIQRPRFQIRAMMRRQKHLLFSIRRTVFADCIQNLVFGIILGTIFWQLPNTLAGANSRDGAVFLALLFIGLSSLSKVRDRYEEKVVFTKQRNASFYDAWTYLLTQALYDFFLELVKAICLFVPLYILAGLSLGSSAQRLLYAILVATFMSLTMISMTRFFVALLDDPNAAQGLCGLFTIVMVLFSGYLKNGSQLQDWLVWIYWADPIHYALEALLINEFDGLDLGCTPEERLPNIPPSDNRIPLDLRICPVQSGIQYLEDFRGITNPNIYRLYYFLVVVAFSVLFFLLSAVATALSRARGYARKSSESEANHLHNDVVVDVSDPISAQSNTAFTFTNLKYAVENGSKVLLNKVTGNTVSGKVVLLMGESGAGKTTLLDVCAMRKTLKHGTSVSGDIRLNGQLISKEELAQNSGYCEQTDLHIGEATVYEAVLFSAKLRLPISMSFKEKQMRTMETLTLLDLEKYSSILVKVLGSGELKLLTMALEVVADPKVLFLDEPTSGISSSSAITVAKALRKIADAGAAVICTVHQPSAEVFSMFDKLLLLKRGGLTVYFGDIGYNAETLRDYFETRGGRKLGTEENPASWMLDVIADNNIDWYALWDVSKERQEREEETKELAGNGDADAESNMNGNVKKVKSRTPAVSKQIAEVIRRQFWSYWRLPEYNVTRVLLNLMIAVLIGLLFLRDVDNSQEGANLAFGALFLTIIPASLAAQNVIPTTVAGRAVFYRETASGTYNPLAYHVAVGIVELPFTIFATTVFAVVFYFMVGLDPSRFFYFFLAIQLLYVMAVMLGVMLASLMPNAAIASNTETSLFSIFQVLSGFFIRKPDLRPWWKWTVWINPFSYYLSGLLSNQMSGQDFECRPEEKLSISLPSNYDSCNDLDNDFGNFEFSNESLMGETTPNRCSFCSVPNGETLIDRYGADDVNKWISLLAIVVVILLFRVLAGYGFARKRFLSR